MKKIPVELKLLDQWVCTKNKVPYQATAPYQASSTNPFTWSSFDEAYGAVLLGNYDDIGFVFTDDDGYVGIDIDNKQESQEIDEMAKDIISECQSYTELSKSGKGWHIILKGDLPFKGRANNRGLEIYKTARYFLMTGKQKYYSEIIHNQAAIDYVLDKYFSDTVVNNGDSNGDRQVIYQPQFRKPSGSKIYLKPIYPEIYSGNRHLSLVSLAGQLLSRGYKRHDILKELTYCNNTACSPPLDETEVIQIVNSVMRYRR